MKTFKLGNLEVWEKDVAHSVHWVTADTLCKSLGEGWRLPTREELKYLYTIHKLGIGRFNYATYWSSSTQITSYKDKESKYFWYKSFKTGSEGTHTGTSTNFARAVRAINF